MAPSSQPFGKRPPATAREGLTTARPRSGCRPQRLTPACAEKSAAPHRNLADVEGFAARLDVLPYDLDAAVHTGQLRAELARAGTPIGPYDQMIAGHARSRGLILVTNERREFERVPGLRIEDWAIP
ncbi:MAG: tRNA(fMet)-specific endonuclease VapC [Burkholderiaceae bacterium]